MKLPYDLSRVAPATAALLLLAAMPAASLQAKAPITETFKIDAVHSNVEFRVRHLMSKVTGRFGKVDGTVTLNSQDIAKSSVNVTIAVNSISTNDAKRDGHLMSPDFFDAAKFPTITFKSTSVKEVAKGKLEVTGTFTMRGGTIALQNPNPTAVDVILQMRSPVATQISQTTVTIPPELVFREST